MTSTVCNCGKGYASDVDGVCRYCREKQYSRAVAKKMGVRYSGDGLDLQAVSWHEAKKQWGVPKRNGTISVGRVGTDLQGYKNVRVDRKSVLGNPSYMPNESYRNKVCDEHIEHFDKEIVIKGSKTHTEVTRIYELAKAGHDINLQCHCHPKRCHADHIKAFLDRFL